MRENDKNFIRNILILGAIIFLLFLLIIFMAKETIKLYKTQQEIKRVEFIKECKKDKHSDFVCLTKWNDNNALFK